MSLRTELGLPLLLATKMSRRRRCPKGLAALSRSTFHPPSFGCGFAALRLFD